MLRHLAKIDQKEGIYVREIYIVLMEWKKFY